MAPAWLDAFAAVWIPLSVLAAVGVLVDVLVLGRRQKMTIMDAVWPLTMLYWGPLGLPIHLWFGRAPAPRKPNVAPDLKDGERRPICSRSLSARRTAARVARSAISSAIGSPSHSP